MSQLARFAAYLGDIRLNIGCAGNKVPGFVNVDQNPAVHPDVVADIEHGLPWPDCSVDSIVASHVMEHLDDLFGAMAELHRVLRVGGHLITFTPHGLSDSAWDNPHHRQCFSLTTMAYFCTALYRAPGGGLGADEGRPTRPWYIVERHLVTFPEHRPKWWKFWEPGLEWKAKHLNNVVQEIQTVMVKRGDE